mgnify:CR=1 FL=1
MSKKFLGTVVFLCVTVMFLEHANAASFGCATKAKWLADPAYAEAVATYCKDFLTAQVDAKAHKTWIQGTNGTVTYNYSDFNIVKNFANAHGMTVRAHALIWGESQPAWFSQLSASQLRAGALGAIDAALDAGARHLEIVNEPERGLGVFDQLGPEFIGDLYEHAAQRCPSCTLAINYLNPPSVSSIAAIDYPLDVIGIEGHLGNSVPNWSDFVQQVKGLGYQVFITEADQSFVAREPIQTFASQMMSAGVDAFIVWNLTKFPDDSWQSAAPLDYPSLAENEMYVGLVEGLKESSGDGGGGQQRGRRGRPTGLSPLDCRSVSHFLGYVYETSSHRSGLRTWAPHR